VVLAGGAGRRIGGSKPLTPLAGRPLIDHALAAAGAAGLEPVVVAKASSGLGTIAAELLHEPESPRHPLLGIAFALERLGEPVVTCPCDCPLLPAELLAALAARPEPAVVVSADAGLEPLVGRYTPWLAGPLMDAADRDLPAGRTVAGLEPALLTGPELSRYGDPAHFLLNVNDRGALAEAELQIKRAGT